MFPRPDTPFPYAETIPYWPVRSLLRDWLGLGISEPEARVRLELRTQLDRLLAKNADEAYPFFAAVLGVKLGREQEERIRDVCPRRRSAADGRLAVPARLPAR